MGHGIIAWIIIGLIAGWLTGKIMKGSGFGFLMDMVVGLIGALIGGWNGGQALTGRGRIGLHAVHDLKIGDLELIRPGGYRRYQCDRGRCYAPGGQGTLQLAQRVDAERVYVDDRRAGGI